MGFGLPSAIGAKVGAPNKIVVDIDGDASFSMTAMELQTASQYNIGVKVMVLNNEFQGMVLQWQGMPHLTSSLASLTRLTPHRRSVLRRAVRAHAHDEPRLRRARTRDGRARDPGEERGGAAGEDEGVPRVRQ